MSLKSFFPPEKVGDKLSKSLLLYFLFYLKKYFI